MGQSGRPFAIVLFALVLLGSKNIEAQIDPRIKTLGVVTVYGVVSGALLGTAALAFDSRGRSPFIGASLGLYAGLLFGGYVVVGHLYRKYRLDGPNPEENYYPDSNSLYEDTRGAGGYLDSGHIYRYWHPFDPSEYERERIKRGLFRKRYRTGIPFSVNVLNIQF